MQAEYLGEEQIVPVYHYDRYASHLDLNAIELHELYKQRSVSETWIEQLKSHTMAETTLTEDFKANDILWQLNVLIYNLSVMMRQKVFLYLFFCDTHSSKLQSVQQLSDPFYRFAISGAPFLQ